VKLISEYSIREHRHNFAVWTAARAAQRGLAGATVKAIGEAIASSGLIDTIAPDTTPPTTPESFDALHRIWSGKLCRSLAGHCKNVSYGRTAKIVAIYLKTVVVIPAREEDRDFIAVIHPPIDAILLRKIGDDKQMHRDVRDCCNKTRERGKGWTSLNEDAYFDVINTFRKHNLHQPAFWMLEQFWAGDADE
jgi:hypothetical protein